MCIVTEFMPFGDLNKYIHNKENPLEDYLALKIALDISSGLVFLHSHKPPIVFRDLKSPNVLLSFVDSTFDICAKVSDFGRNSKFFKSF